MRSMRFFAVILALCCLVPASLLLVPARGSANQLETVIQSGRYWIIPEARGHRIVMEGFSYRMEPGKPMLPEKEFLIALPPGARVQRVEARGIGGTMLPGIHRIVPVPAIVPLAEPPLYLELMAGMQREWQESNEATYSIDDVYPKEIGRITCSGSLRQYAYASVAVCPFGYFPLSGRLTHYDAVRVTVHFSLPPRGSDRALEIEGLMHD
jgi:hypothetical protein